MTSIMRRQKRKVLVLALLSTVMVVLAVPSIGFGAEAPIKEVLSSHLGWKVNKTTGGNVCTVSSGNECQEGIPSGEAGGFENLWGIAASESGDVYVADLGNERIDELDSSGAFVSMFGKEVNATNKSNACTEVEIKAGVKCKTGIEGTGAGEFKEPTSLAVDPTSSDIYVQEHGNGRVDEYTPAGQFVWMVGKDVNKTKVESVKALEGKGGKPTPLELEEQNRCTAASGNQCQAGESSESTEHGAFDFEGQGTNLLAVGPNDLLYVSSKGRVQEFEADGEWKAEIPVAGNAGKLAVDTTGDLYVVHGEASVIHEFDLSGTEIKEFAVEAREPNPEELTISTIALDSAGQLAVGIRELHKGRATKFFGSLYDASTGKRITEFPTVGIYGTFSLAFNGKDELYGISPYEASTYVPERVGELLASRVSCVSGVEHETDETLACSLNGEVDPWGISETEVWFQWGRTAGLGSETAKVPVLTEEAFKPVSAQLGVVRPNEAALYYRLAGEDQHVKSPEFLVSQTASFSTPMVAPKIVGEPSATFVQPTSVVLSGELNPENASTRYRFQYGACEENNPAQCTSSPYTGETAVMESAEYEKVGTELQANGLQPNTTYHYRLLAESENNTKTEKLESRGQEATFTTAPAPTVKAQSAPASAIGVNSAIVSGSVEPDGQPAAYSFEAGVYEGAATRYGIVSSGTVPASTGAVQETLALTGLQPGTTYAYRLRIAGGYEEVAYSQPAIFTTAGLPSVLVSPPSLAMLTVPSITFPKATNIPTAKKKTKAKKKKPGKPKQRRAAKNSKARGRKRQNAKK